MESRNSVPETTGTNVETVEKTNHQKMVVLMEGMNTNERLEIGPRILIGENLLNGGITLTILTKHPGQERYRKYEVTSFPNGSISYRIEGKTQRNKGVDKEIQEFITGFEHYSQKALIRKKQISINKE